jgi:hypothetical protein
VLTNTSPIPGAAQPQPKWEGFLAQLEKSLGMHLEALEAWTKTKQH